MQLVVRRLMSRYARRPSTLGYSFGPGPMTPAVKWLIIANAAMFLVSTAYRPIIEFLGLIPERVFEGLSIWQVGSYTFLHGGPIHLLFNMLGVWMFGWSSIPVGTGEFLSHYAITGIGAGITVLVVSLLPFDSTARTYRAVTIGASGALFGLLMAFAYYYPDRPILMFLLFPIPAKYFVIIVGAMAFLSAPNSQVSEAAHLGGLIFGYLYLRGGRGGMSAEISIATWKWKMNRLRRKFDVYSGGRSDWDRHVH